MKKRICQFALRSDVVLRDVVVQDIGLNCTSRNITKELALYHLATNPRCIKYFVTLPDDWQEQVACYKEMVWGKGTNIFFGNSILEVITRGFRQLFIYTKNNAFGVILKEKYPASLARGHPY